MPKSMKKEIEGLSKPLLRVVISNAKSRISESKRTLKYKQRIANKEYKNETKYSVKALALAKSELLKRRKK